MGTAHWVLKKADSLPGLIATGKLGLTWPGEFERVAGAPLEKNLGA
jgi:hypothetical protein